MFDELRTWWQNASPETTVLIRQGGLMLAALLGGHYLGRMVVRVLQARNFDAALRLPGSSGASAVREFTPTFVAGMLVRFTVWAAAARWLAGQYGWTEWVTTLGMIVNRAWALAAVLVAALAVGSFLTGRVMECLRTGLDGAASRNGAMGSGRGVAGAVGAAVYCLVTILTLLMAADFFDWPLTRSAALALWQFAQHLLVAGAALLIGYLGAGWARDLVTLDSATTPEKRAGQYTGLAIVATTTVLAVAVMLTSAGVFFGLSALAVLGLALWLVRGHLPDIAAGLQLRANQVSEVWFDGSPYQVGNVGLVSTEVGRGGQNNRVRNRQVLEARMHGAPAMAGRR
jgi:hypothetical protein